MSFCLLLLLSPSLFCLSRETVDWNKEFEFNFEIDGKLLSVLTWKLIGSTSHLEMTPGQWDYTKDIVLSHCKSFPPKWST